jgi:hypothetical protein
MTKLPGRAPMAQRYDTGLSDFHLATAELWGNWDSNGKYHVNLMLSCGPEILNGGDRKYEANLKQCRVKLYSDKCKADFSDAYSYELPATSFSSNVTASDSFEIHKKRDGEFGVAGTGAAEHSLWWRLLGKIGFAASRKEERRAKFNRNTRSEQVVSIG